MQQYDYDVIICGAGPVGALTACLLGRYGVRVLIVDKYPAPPQIPRAIALDEESQSILDLVGVNQNLAELSPRIDEIDMRSNFLGTVFKLDSSKPKDGFARIITFYQPELEALLLEKIKSFPSVELKRSAELIAFEAVNDSVTARIDQNESTRVVTARYLLGCDGAKSLVRQKLDIQFKGKCSSEDWLIVDALKDPIPDHRIRYHANPFRPSVTMPGPEGRRRWEFLLQKDEMKQATSKAFLHELLTPWGDPEAMQIERSVVYNFQSKIAARYSNGNRQEPGNVFLLGDAAHLTPPFIGQGLCAGIRDANNLAWKINWVLKGYAGEHILTSYENERKPHTWANIRMAGLLGQLITDRNRYRAAFKAMLVKAAVSLPGIGCKLQSIDLKPLNRIERGLYLPGSIFKAGNSELLGRYLIAGDGLGKDLVLLEPKTKSETQKVPSVWQAAGGSVRQNESEEVMVIRPDKVVAAIGSKNKTNQLASDFSRLLKTG